MKSRLILERILHNWPIKILSVLAAVLLFFFYRISSLEERFFNVPLEVKVHENFIPAESYPETVRVIIKGRSEDIKLILEDEIEAVVDFSEYGDEGRLRKPIEINRKGLALQINPLEIVIEPREIDLLFESMMTKTFPVTPAIIGFPDKGYEMVQYFITPSSVEVYGGRSKIENLEEILTDNIDISSRISDFTTRVRLKTPDPSIQISGGNIVEFSAYVKEITIVRSMSDVDIITLDLDNRFQLGGFGTMNTMQIQGKLLELQKYNPEDYRFTVDCSTLTEPGRYSLPVIPDIPAGILVLNYEPKEITVEITEIDQ